MHSFKSVHVNPSPVNPALHVQLYDPTVLLQIALTLQLLEVVHSSTSLWEEVQRLIKKTLEVKQHRLRDEKRRLIRTGNFDRNHCLSIRNMRESPTAA